MSEGVFDLYAFLMGGMSSPTYAPLPYEPVEFPADIPDVSGVRAISFISDWSVQTSESPWTFKRQTFSTFGDRWRAVVELPPMNRQVAGQWQGLLLLLEGGYQNFLFGDVFNPSPMGLALGTPRVDGASQEGRTLNTKGWTANITGQLLAGDKIQIGNRLHQVLRNVNSDASGNATIDIFPSLRESPPDSLIIETEETRGLFALKDAVLQVSEVDITGIYKSVTFEVVEDI